MMQGSLAAFFPWLLPLKMVTFNLKLRIFLLSKAGAIFLYEGAKQL